MRICLLLLPLVLAACMAVPESTTRAATPPAHSTSESLSPDTLARYHWQLHDAVSYLIVEGRLDVAPMMHTMMACHDQTLMQREHTITAMLSSKPTLILSMTGSTPTLTLTADDGQTLTFAGSTTQGP